jgi:nucleoside-diphosphate-sugar epimerase
MLAAAQAPGIEGHSLDLGTGRACSAREMVECIWAMSGAQGDILAGALPYRPGEVMHLVADADRTTRLTGWRARVELEDGLRDMLSWYRQFPSQDLRLADELAVSKQETKL